MLCDKYAPTTLNKIIGNRTAIEKLVDFGISWQKGERPRPIIIYGPSGVGKTAAARALAYSNGFDLVELGANDYRDAKSIEKMLLPASRSVTLYNNRLLILMDEIDELSGKFDAGAEKAILALLKNSMQPIIFIANNFWSQKIAFLREHVDKVEFKKVPPDEIVSLLKSIAGKEGIGIDDKTIERIAASSNGDVRGAINDLEAMAGAKPELIENLGIRSRKVEIFGVLDGILLSKSFYTAKAALENSDVELEMVLNWLEENLPKRYLSRQSLSRAYDELALASRFLEKAKRTSYYGYLRYVNVLSSSGVSLASDGNISMIKPYSFPAKVKYLSSTKDYRSLLNITATSLISILHTDKRSIISTFMPMLATMIRKGLEEVGSDETFEFIEANYRIPKEAAEVIAGIRSR
ncbi:MAG: replication factor C large subunit [Candidatus Micrarchaeia archaeon]